MLKFLFCIKKSPIHGVGNLSKKEIRDILLPSPRKGSSSCDSEAQVLLNCPLNFIIGKKKKRYNLYFMKIKKGANTLRRF